VLECKRRLLLLSIIVARAFHQSIQFLLEDLRYDEGVAIGRRWRRRQQLDWQRNMLGGEMIALDINNDPYFGGTPVDILAIQHRATSTHMIVSDEQVETLVDGMSRARASSRILMIRGR